MQGIHKECKLCHERKSESEFWPNAQNKDGLLSYCKECNTKRTREWHNAHPKAQQIYNRKSMAARKAEESGSSPSFVAIGEKACGICAYCGKDFEYVKSRRARTYCSMNHRSRALHE